MPRKGPRDEARPAAAAAAGLLDTILLGGAVRGGLRVFCKCFALGFAFGVPTLMLLVQNAGMLGAMLWLFHGQGLTLEVVGWLSIHGTTELFAITLAGAAGLATQMNAPLLAGDRYMQVVPGSHCRASTPAELAVLRAERAGVLAAVMPGVARDMAARGGMIVHRKLAKTTT